MTADANYVERFPDTGFDFYEMASILCAGLTVYKGIKASELKPSNWVAISGYCARYIRADLTVTSALPK